MNNQVIIFAREELNKYLEKLSVNAKISLGLFNEFDVEMELNDPCYDDAYVISVKDKKGFIAGSNERSVLFGVYRLLEEWGITWVRPGPNGTNYPKECTADDIEIKDSADTRNRIMYVDGTFSIENALDMIEWIPKVGFNGYYIQSNKAHEYFENWYNHQMSTIKQPEQYTVEQTEEYVKLISVEIEKRGLYTYADDSKIRNDHIISDQIFDAGGEAIARIVHKDIQNFDNSGLDVFTGCLLQRNAFPSSIVMTTIGKTLWKHDTDFQKLRCDLYAAAFGKYSVETTTDYFALLSKAFDIEVIHGQKQFNASEFKTNLEAAITAMEYLEFYVNRKFWEIGDSDPCQKDSWVYLNIHRKIYTFLARSLIAKINGEFEKSEEYLKKSQEIAFENEDILQPVFDCMFYAKITNENINLLNT